MGVLPDSGGAAVGGITGRCDGDHTGYLGNSAGREPTHGTERDVWGPRNGCVPVIKTLSLGAAYFFTLCEELIWLVTFVIVDSSTGLCFPPIFKILG